MAELTIELVSDAVARLAEHDAAMRAREHPEPKRDHLATLHAEESTQPKE